MNTLALRATALAPLPTATPVPTGAPSLPPRKPPFPTVGLGAFGFIDPEQFASFLDVSRAQFFKMKSAGSIPDPVYFGRAPRWSIIEVPAWSLAGAPRAEIWRPMRDEAIARFMRSCGLLTTHPR